MGGNGSNRSINVFPSAYQSTNLCLSQAENSASPSIHPSTTDQCLPSSSSQKRVLHENELSERVRYIYKCNKLTLMLTEEEVSGSSTFLGHLEYLAMRSCKELVSLSDEFMCHLSSLKILAIDHCKNLVGSLSSCSSSIEGKGLQLQHITTIERLRIWWCDKVVGNPLKLPGPCLRELTLFNCLNLQSLSLSGLNAPQFLSIRSCQNLASFPDGLGHLAALEELEIIDCPGLTTLPEWLGCLTNLRRLDVGSQTLVSLPQSLGYLPALRNLVFRYVTWTCLPDWLGGLTTVVELKVSGCSSLTSLPEGLGRLTQLEVLCIDDCPRLTSLPEDLQPQLPRLKWLIIVSSPKLARQCTPGGKYWHLISQIPSRAINLRSNTIENSWKYCAVWTEPQQHRSLQLLL